MPVTMPHALYELGRTGLADYTESERAKAKLPVPDYGLEREMNNKKNVCAPLLLAFSDGQKTFAAGYPALIHPRAPSASRMARAASV